MKVALRKNVKVDDISLNKGDIGWVRGFRFGGDHDKCMVDVGDHRMLLIDKTTLDFPKETKNEISTNN